MKFHHAPIGGRASRIEIGGCWRIICSVNARPEHVAHAVVVLVPEHEQVHVELPGALQDDAPDVMLRRAQQLSVCVDARSRQPVDQCLNHVAVHDFNVVLGGAYAET